MSSTLARMPDNFVACRSYGHVWEPTTVYRVINSRNVVVEYHASLECPRCETVRTQVYDFEGSVVRTGYTYPKWYRKHPDEDPITIRSARIEFMGRSKDIRTIHQEEA